MREGGYVIDFKVGQSFGEPHVSRIAGNQRGAPEQIVWLCLTDSPPFDPRFSRPIPIMPPRVGGSQHRNHSVSPFCCKRPSTKMALPTVLQTMRPDACLLFLKSPQSP